MLQIDLNRLESRTLSIIILAIQVQNAEYKLHGALDSLAYPNKRKMTSHNILKKNNLREISLPIGITDTESLSNLPNISMLKHFINTNEDFTSLIKGPLK